MDDVELRDLAVDAAERHRAEEEARVGKPEAAQLRSFWTTHIRINIDEAESRDHLALERTFLSYVRTASAFAQLGVIIAQLFRLNLSDAQTITPTTLRVGKGLGATVEAVAIVVQLLGAAYFAKQQIGLMKGVIWGRSYEIYVMMALSFALLVIILGLLAGATNW